MKLTVTAEDIEAGIAAWRAGGRLSQSCAVAQAFKRYGIPFDTVAVGAWVWHGVAHRNPADLARFIGVFDAHVTVGRPKPTPAAFIVPDSWLPKVPA